MVKILDNFANIGKAVLIQSIGLQKNYIEVKESETSVIDYNNATCTDCKYKAFIQAFAPDSEAYLSACEACRNCPHKIFTQKTEYKKIYHNETNRFGYKPRLKTNAIKLLLLLHFYHPDRFGIIKNIDIRELAEHLHCDIKTVKNNLEILNRYAYVTYARTDSYIITLCLNDYTSYYLPARQGGRGFIVLSKKLLSQILEIDTLVTLRIYLRQLISIDNLNAKGGPFTAISNTYKDLKRFLPEYCKPNIIRKAVQTSNDIFTITLNTNGIRFEIKDEYNAKKQKESCYQYYIHQLHQFVMDFNKTVTSVNVNNSIPARYAEYFNDRQTVDYYRLIHFKDYEVEDLAMLSLQYSFDTVMYALSSIYKTYILKEHEIKNLGGLVRTAIMAQLKTSYQAA